MELFVLQEETHHNNRVVFISESIEKCKDIVREKYKIDEDDINYLVEWGEVINIFMDIKLRIEKIETDTFVMF